MSYSFLAVAANDGRNTEEENVPSEDFGGFYNIEVVPIRDTGRSTSHMRYLDEKMVLW